MPRDTRTCAPISMLSAQQTRTTTNMIGDVLALTHTRPPVLTSLGDVCFIPGCAQVTSNNETSDSLALTHCTAAVTPAAPGGEPKVEAQASQSASPGKVPETVVSDSDEGEDCHVVFETSAAVDAVDEDAPGPRHRACVASN